MYHQAPIKIGVYAGDLKQIEQTMAYRHGLEERECVVFSQPKSR